MERIEGHIVDMQCVRRWPQTHWQDRSRKHLTACAEAHLESGFCLVDDCAVFLDEAATPMVLRALREVGDEKGVRLRAVRKPVEGLMVTTFVDRAIPREPLDSSTIRSAGWHDSILELEFASGPREPGSRDGESSAPSRIYQYLDVPREIFEELMGADSQGRYFNSRIKSRFQSRKV